MAAAKASSDRGRNSTTAVRRPGVEVRIITAGTTWANRFTKGMAKKLSPITGQREASRADNGPATQTALIFTAVMKEWGTAQTCGLPKPSRTHRLPRNA